MRTVHVVVPDRIDDPRRPSGGNWYDRRLCTALSAAGWRIHEHPVPGSWPRPDPADLAHLGRALAAIPDGEVVLLDGLVASAAADPLVPESGRLRLVVLVHMPLGAPDTPDDSDPVTAGERAVLEAAAAVVTTSDWTRNLLVQGYGLPAARIQVARPGVDPAEPASATDSGGELLCVAAVTPGKGHDVLVRALADVREEAWRCWCVGSLEVDPAHAREVRRLAEAAGLAGRIRFCGALTGDALAARYAAADLLVLPTRAETYGMVVVEALARGLPVLATGVGGIAEALGSTPGGPPGVLVPPDDPAALAAALGTWLDDPGLRRRLRRAAVARRATLTGWDDTAAEVSQVLASARR